jgi:hypothetical protein
MRSLIFGIACSIFSGPVVGIPTKGALGVYFEADAPESPLLKLDYATYKGTYHNDSDVLLTHSSQSMQELTDVQDIPIQKHPLRCSAAW